MTRAPGRRVFVLLAGVGIGLLALGGCSRPFVSPLGVPPYRDHTPAPYDDTWKALIRALAMENLPLRTLATDPGVIASAEPGSPIRIPAHAAPHGGLSPAGD